MITSKDLDYVKYKNYLGKIMSKYVLLGKIKIIDQYELELVWSDCIYNLCKELNMMQPKYVDAWAYNVIKSTYIGYLRRKWSDKRKPLTLKEYEYINYNYELSIYEKIDLNNVLSKLNKKTYEWLILVAKGYSGNEASAKLKYGKNYTQKLKNEALISFKEYYS